MAKKPVKTRKRKSKIILPPTMEERGLQTRKLAEQIEKSWPPGCVHLVGNQSAIVASLRPTDPSQATRIVARLKEFLTELM